MIEKQITPEAGIEPEAGIKPGSVCTAQENVIQLLSRGLTNFITILVFVPCSFPFSLELKVTPSTLMTLGDAPFYS